MVKIRLSRGGTKKRPFFHVVATDSRSSRDGKYIERLGFFNPSALGHEEDIRIDLKRVKYWESQGAILSDRVRSLIKLLAVDREQRKAKRDEKLNKKKVARKEKKVQETPAEEPAAETKDEPEAAEATPAEEPAAETKDEPEAAEATPAEEPAAETKDEPEAAEATQTEDKDNNKTVKS